jgi:ankyrin repeat protein
MNHQTAITKDAAERLLHSYAKDGKAEELRTLLRERSDIDVNALDLTSSPSTTAAGLAAMRRNGSEVMQALVDAGADVMRADAWGLTPAMHAASYGAAETLRVLAQAGVDIAQVGEKGYSAFSYIDIYRPGTNEVISQLLNAGCDPNEYVGDDEGEHVLFLLNQNKALPELHLVLEAGADPLMVDEKGETPMQIAAAGGHQSAEQLLRHYANMPRFMANKTYGAEELMRERNNGQRLADNPHNWRLLQSDFGQWAQKDDLPDRNALMAVGGEALSAAQVAFAARCGETLLRCLDAHGEKLEMEDLYQNQQPTPLLETMCRTGQAALLFAPQRAQHYAPSVLRDIHTRLPDEQKNAVPLFRILMEKQAETQEKTGMRGR